MTDPEHPDPPEAEDHGRGARAGAAIAVYLVAITLVGGALAVDGCL